MATRGGKAAGRRGEGSRRGAAGKGAARWSRQVMETSDALDLEPGVFRLPDARRIARSLKRSAERSSRRKGEPFRSAMSMLTFFINRGGKNLPAARRRVLEEAKVELRKVFHREPGRAGRAAKRE